MAKIVWKRKPLIELLKAVALLCAIAFLLVVFIPNPEPCNCDKTDGKTDSKNKGRRGIDPGGLVDKLRAKRDKDRNTYGSRHKLAVIVPFRDRYAELFQFAPHLHKYLKSKNIDHKIYVLNQEDDLRFNRASLINVGYLLSHTECDYIAMHDVDLLPNNLALNYSYPRDFLFHVAAPSLHPRYHYAAFIGGILLVNNNHFKLVNGMSNKYYGWGMEDDEFYVRILEMNLTVHRPTHITTGLKTFKHVHSKERPRDYKQYGSQRKDSRARDRETGVDNVDFDFKYISEMTIEGAPVTLVGVELNCDIELTPWCMHPEQLEKIVNKQYPNTNKEETDEDKRLEAVKSSILQYQEQITEFRSKIKPLRTVDASELPKWMKNSATR